MSDDSQIFWQNQDREKTVELNFNRRVENCSVINRFHLKSRSPKQKNSSEEKVSKRVKFNMEKDTGVFLLRCESLKVDETKPGSCVVSDLRCLGTPSAGQGVMPPPLMLLFSCWLLPEFERLLA